MKYYVMLSEDEIKMVCSIYPPKELVNGFRKCSKDFSALMPGHRPQAVQCEAGRKLLVNNPRSRLTAKMVEVLLSVWVPQVTKAIEQYSDNTPKDIAYILAFSKVGFVDIAQVYFHLVGEEIDDKQIYAIIQGTKALEIDRKETTSKEEILAVQSELAVEKEKHANDISAKDHIISNQSITLERLNNELEEQKRQIDALLSERKKNEGLQQQLDLTNQALDEAIAKKNELEALIATLQDKIENLQSECNSAKEKAHSAIEEKADILSQLSLCKEKLSKIENRIALLKSKTYLSNQEELKPCNMDDFIEYFQYNLNSIGIDSSSDYTRIFIRYLIDILFQNKPILCNRTVGIAIASCVANTICGSSAPLVIPYSKEITSDDLLSLLSTDERVVILDSFFGNYNETELLSVLSSVKRKIVFATVTYDHTVAYLPQEILFYCNYLNVDNIGAFLTSSCTTEDPSEIPEELTIPTFVEPKPKCKKLCKEIVIQLEYEEAYAEYISTQMTSEDKLIAYLAYSILPYYSVVNKVSPYLKSERLEKYAGSLGTCPHKDLLMRWFGDE